MKDDISIHAPRVRGDGVTRAAVVYWEFQSTPLV